MTPLQLRLLNEASDGTTIHADSKLIQAMAIAILELKRENLELTKLVESLQSGEELTNGIIQAMERRLNEIDERSKKRHIDL